MEPSGRYTRRENERLTWKARNEISFAVGRVEKERVHEDGGWAGRESNRERTRRKKFWRRASERSNRSFQNNHCGTDLAQARELAAQKAKEHGVDQRRTPRNALVQKRKKSEGKFKREIKRNSKRRAFASTQLNKVSCAVSSYGR